MGSNMRVLRCGVHIAVAILLLLAVFTPFQAGAEETPRPARVLAETDAPPAEPAAAVDTVDTAIAAPAVPALTPATALPPPPPSLTPGRPASAAVPTPTPTAALTNDMRNILRKVGTIPCVEPTRGRIFALLYESNVALHDKCLADAKYQFFPYTGKLPTTTQVIAIVKSTACMQLFAGAILAHFPECDIDFVSIRSSAEVFYRIKADIDAARVPPTQAQFYEFYNLNRVVNLLNENETLIEDVFRDSPTTAAVSLSEMTRLMNPIQLLAGVTVGDDMVIKVAGEAPLVVKKSTAATSSNQSQDVSIHGSLNGSSGAAGAKTTKLPPPPLSPGSPQASATNRTSSAWTATHHVGAGWSHVAVGVAVALVLALVVES